MSKSRRKSDKKLLLSCSVLGDDSRWLDNYLAITAGRRPLEPDFHMDLLKDLWQEQIDDNLVIHLLALVEQFAGRLDCDSVEQTVGSLINIFSSLPSSRSYLIRQKFIFTTTSLLIIHIDLTLSNLSLRSLFVDFIQLLIESVQRTDDLISSAAAECIKEIRIFAPELLEGTCDIKNRLQSSRPDLFLSSFDGKSQAQLVEVSAKLPQLPPIQLHHTLTQMFATIKTQLSQKYISPMIFKSFIKPFALSTEIYQFHFTLQLLKSFGLELFSTSEEHLLLKQLVVVATHPSLSIAHRLLTLDYLESFIPMIKRSNINLNINLDQLDIKPFDGPDTQEKKLAILSKLDIDDKSLLNKLKSLELLSLSNNRRAKIAFYRIIYLFITRRDQMTVDIEDLLLNVILSAPLEHVRPCLSLLDAVPKLATGTSNKLIETLLDKSTTITKNPNEFKEFVCAIEWMLRRVDLKLSENQINDLLNLVFDHCSKTRSLFAETSACCSAVLFKQMITFKIKETIKRILEFLSQECNDISISSLSQIYLIALNTLQDEENVKRIFNEEFCLEKDFDLVKEYSNPAPIVIKRVGSDKNRIKSIDDKPYFLKMTFEVSISQQATEELDETFAVILFFDSLDGRIHEEIEIAYLPKSETMQVQFSTSANLVGPFTLSVSAHFNDARGTIYKCDSFYQENVLLQDILLPVEVDTNFPFEKICDTVMKESNAIESHIRLDHFSSIDQFLDTFSWLILYYHSDLHCIITATPPDKLFVADVRIINGFVNLHVFCNDHQLLLKLFYMFKE